MAEMFWPECVLYNCSCNLASPFSHLYFCRYCVEPRCQMCVYHEIDSYFCSNCLENMPSAEAKLKKNRCANCYECPSCGNTLSTRATAVAIKSENPDEKATAKKVFYLACGFCRWSTRDVGIPDRNNASGGWHEPENPVSKRVNNLVDYYRKLAIKEKYEREKTKLKKKNYIHITSPSSFSLKNKSGNLGLLKKRSSLSLLKSLSLSRGDSFDEDAVLADPAKAKEEPPRQPLYTEVIQLEKAASISQMVDQPEFQHSQTWSYLPQLQIAQVPELQFQKKVRVTLSLKNPVDYPVNVTVKPVQVIRPEIELQDETSQSSETATEGDVKEQADDKKENQKGEKEGRVQRIGEEILDKALVDKQLKIAVDNSADNKIFEETAELNLPASPLYLAAKDDAAEFDENEIITTKYKDDPDMSKEKPLPQLCIPPEIK